MNWRTIGSMAFYLGFLLVGCVGCYELTQRGLFPAVSLAIITLTGMSVLFLGQRLWPYCQAWRHWKSEIVLDILHSLFSTVGASAVYQATVIALVFSFADWSARTIGWQIWPDSLSLWIQVPVGLLVADFGAYWFHRLAHKTPILWRIHALHHSSEQLYVLSSGRNHPLNVIGTFTASTFPLVLMGANGDVLLLISIFTSLNGLLQHANMDLRLGLLNWIFSGPELHRLHHSLRIEESNTNFGSNLIIWDVVFRTRYCPKDRKIEQIGLSDMIFSKNYWAQLAIPFSWRKWIDTSADAVSSIQGPQSPPQALCPPTV